MFVFWYVLLAGRFLDSDISKNILNWKGKRRWEGWGEGGAGVIMGKAWSKLKGRDSNTQLISLTKRTHFLFLSDHMNIQAQNTHNKCLHLHTLIHTHIHTQPHLSTYKHTHTHTPCLDKAYISCDAHGWREVGVTGGECGREGEWQWLLAISAQH